MGVCRYKASYIASAPAGRVGLLVPSQSELDFSYLAKRVGRFLLPAEAAPILLGELVVERQQAVENGRVAFAHDELGSWIDGLFRIALGGRFEQRGAAHPGEHVLKRTPGQTQIGLGAEAFGLGLLAELRFDFQRSASLGIAHGSHRGHGEHESCRRGSQRGHHAVPPAPAPGALRQVHAPRPDRAVLQESLQVVGQFAGTGVAMLRPARDRLEHDRFQVAGNPGIDLRGRGGLASQT